jgi:signal peptidase
MAVAITLVFTFVQFDALRGFIHFGGSPSTLFFGSIAPLLALNAVLTYMAHDGALSALVLLRAVYSLAVVFLPVLPNISGVAWAVIECAMLLITLTAYRYAMTDQRGQLAIAEKRREKYRRKPIISYMVTAGLVLVLIAFNLRAFPIFPVVVLTDSMAGAVDSGSIVFVERVQPANVLTSVGIGDVILYRQGSIEIMHRVIEFDYTIAGERVFITQGDNNPTADHRPVEMGQVLGISRSYIPYLGYPALWLRMIFR